MTNYPSYVPALFLQIVTMILGFTISFSVCKEVIPEEDWEFTLNWGPNQPLPCDPMSANIGICFNLHDSCDYLLVFCLHASL